MVHLRSFSLHCALKSSARHPSNSERTVSRIHTSAVSWLSVLILGTVVVSSCSPEPIAGELTPLQKLMATPPEQLRLQDSDGDGISDYDEMIQFGTNPLWVDSDGDGLVDGGEVKEYTTNPLDADSDGDGLSDGDEVLVYNTDPTNSDSDGDGTPDGEEDLEPMGERTEGFAADSLGSSGLEADSLGAMALSDSVLVDSLDEAAQQAEFAWTHGDSLTKLTADLVDGLDPDSVFAMAIPTEEEIPQMLPGESLYEFSERLRAMGFDVEAIFGSMDEFEDPVGEDSVVVEELAIAEEIPVDSLADSTLEEMAMGVDSLAAQDSLADAVVVGDGLLDSLTRQPEEPSGPSLYEMFPPDESRRERLSYGRTRDRSNEKRVVLFFGNSITAGFGLSPEEAFPALIGEKIDSLGLPFRVVNAGLSGETSAGGLGRVEWVLRVPVHVFVLELGGNDGLRGLPPTSTYENLRGIIEKVRARHPSAKILLTGMEAPPNMGPRFTDAFRKLYADLAKEMDVTFMPFILQDVGGIPELNLPDGIHPTPQGHRIIAENLWPYLLPMLEP